MNIYELTTECHTLAVLLDTDEISDELRVKAEALQQEILLFLIPEKVESYCHVIARMQADAELLHAEEKRLADRRRVRENTVTRLKSTLQDALAAADCRKLAAGKWTVGIQASPPSVEITDESQIPKSYYIPVEPRLDKAGIRDALKAGVEVPGAVLAQHDHIRIR
jgi:hypothetical protein